MDGHAGEPSTPLSDERYRSLMEQHPDGVYEFDLQGRFVDGNDALAHLTGYRVEELLGRTFLEIVHPADAERVREEFLEAAAGRTRSYDTAGRSKHGGLFHVNITNVPIVIDDEVVGVYGIARDISETRTARRDLEHSEARFRQMFTSAGVGIAILDLAGAFVRSNPAFLAMAGYDHDGLAGHDLPTLTHPDHRARLDDALRLLVETNPPSVAVQVRCVRRDDRIVWLRLSLTLLLWSDELPPFVMVTAEDVTALRQTDERFEHSQSLVRMAHDIARIGGWRLDRDTGEMHWSREIHDILGVPLGTTPTLESSLASYLPGDRPRVAAALDACMEEATPFDLEVQLEPRRGQRMWVRVTGEPERDPSGRVTGIHGALQDIDRHKQSERETRELAERLAATLESTTDAVLTVDRDWRYTYMNTHAAELLQRPRAELLGRVLWDEFPLLRGTVVEEVYRRVARSGVAETLEEYYYAPFQSWFELNVHPADGGIAVYFRDVTTRRDAGLQLQERAAQLRQQARLLDKARDAIIVRDADGCITYWNHSAERLYGWSQQEALGRRERKLLFGDATDFDEAERQTYAEGEWTGELTQVDRLGREVVVEARWTLVHDEEDQAPSILAIKTDVTDRRRLEQQFLQAQRMESLGTLASGIAHDLNNAMSPVLMASQLLADDETDPDRRELLDIVNDSTRRGAEMVQQVLSFARGMEGRRVPCDLGATVRDVQRLIRDTFPKDIAVRPNVAPDLWPVVGDPTQLHQVLLNLCLNARDAMPEGGTLSVSATNLVDEGRQRPNRRPLEPGPFVRITVSDTGEGMTGEVLDRVFEPFYTTKSKESGTGLGLSTSLGIIESHGGVLEAHSRPGIGSIFTIDLPADPTVTHPDEEPAPSQSHGSGELVLLVDDEPTVRHLARVTLERAGYRVVSATDGLDAIEQARAHRDDLAVVVTDMMMPHMDGATAVGHIRQARPDLPVVAMSGLRIELERDARAMGTTHLLRKPFAPDELVDVVAAALASSVVG